MCNFSNNSFSATLHLEFVSVEEIGTLYMKSDSSKKCTMLAEVHKAWTDDTGFRDQKRYKKAKRIH
jgi:hypothetical protein